MRLRSVLSPSKIFN